MGGSMDRWMFGFTLSWEPCSLAGSFLDRGGRSSLLALEARNPASSLPGALSPRHSPLLPQGPINHLQELPLAWGGTCLRFSVQSAQLMRGFVKFLIMASMPGLIICIWLLQVRRGCLHAALLLSPTFDFN